MGFSLPQINHLLEYTHLLVLRELNGLLTGLGGRFPECGVHDLEVCVCEISLNFVLYPNQIIPLLNVR
jgi:hypothetical protein